MDDRIGLFLADVLALEGEKPEAIRQAVRTALTDCEAAREANKHMKEKAAHACHSLCRAASPKKCGGGRERRQRSI
jgi:hypothetical protein